MRIIKFRSVWCGGLITIQGMLFFAHCPKLMSLTIKSKTIRKLRMPLLKKPSARPLTSMGGKGTIWAKLVNILLIMALWKLMKKKNLNKLLRTHLIKWKPTPVTGSFQNYFLKRNKKKQMMVCLQLKISSTPNICWRIMSFACQKLIKLLLESIQKAKELDA